MYDVGQWYRRQTPGTGGNGAHYISASTMEKKKYSSMPGRPKMVIWPSLYAGGASNWACIHVFLLSISPPSQCIGRIPFSDFSASGPYLRGGDLRNGQTHISAAKDAECQTYITSNMQKVSSYITSSYKTFGSRSGPKRQTIC